MPGYVKNALRRFNHKPTNHNQTSPRPYTRPTYGAHIQYADNLLPPNITLEQRKFIQQVVGVFLFYGRAFDSTMLSAISSIVCNLSTAQWKDTQHRINHFLGYAATNPDAALIYKASDMHFRIHTDTSYLTESKARSRAGGYHFFSDKPILQITANSPPPMHNHPVLVLCKLIDAVMSSTQESETGAGIINAREDLAIRQAAIEMGHPQGPTPYNSTIYMQPGSLREKSNKSKVSPWICATIGYEIERWRRNNLPFTGRKLNAT